MLFFAGNFIFSKSLTLLSLAGNMEATDLFSGCQIFTESAVWSIRYNECKSKKCPNQIHNPVCANISLEWDIVSVQMLVTQTLGGHTLCNRVSVSQTGWEFETTA